MKINIHNLTLHNFLSFGHSEICFDNSGYCLISGVNNCSKDNALSNGSGKSTLCSAISYCLTGKTIQGIKSNLKNIYIDEDLCYVTLTMTVDSNEYEITRWHKPKSNLSIIINGEDKSGKTYTESENLLNTYLPDLNIDLISSIIILGQGMPNRLSSHTPAEQKALLEKLSKSDFMIEDMKIRIANRITTLNRDKRELEDKLLASKTSYTMYENSKNKAIKDRDSFVFPNFEEEFKHLDNSELNIKNKISELESSVTNLESQKDEFEKGVNALLTVFESEKSTVESWFESESTKLNSSILPLKMKINALKSEINRLKSIKDICPTCGQKLPDVVKPDTTKYEEDLNTSTDELDKLEKELSNLKVGKDTKIQGLRHDFDIDTKDLKTKLTELNASLGTLRNDIIKENQSLSNVVVARTKLENEQSNIDTKYNSILATISDNERLMQEETEKKISFETALDVVNSHLDVVKKFESLTKRDFRGYLLQNVISFLNEKSKEYSLEVFGTDELNITLDGNNLDISYCNKNIESLSGGEKQRVDIILQFAIRDLMSTYLNFSSNLIFLDEIFDNLDSLSTSKVLNLISNKLNVENIFIISHHTSDLDIPYDNEIIIEKNEEGVSRIK